ncbi:MAG: electron transport complex subunit RsxC [Candidatus Cloacimonadaceae bacterium]|nr:electron transport complex subunit RsxC [Candidatus Cloacimonadota bacterium]MCB5254254.1 electron transport complex subunit RsxC [Candidatus Cloacimonadota bacterium]MCK9178804.1 electron transport complex subunit RsxC [Candidatus Cloacimonadota bacterium]MCK9243323.1 electron transport complex subunit RsxC [Candidatus Cloacimonadota bacterium]MDY0128325.1 electron transport complex subunit RsxC [Candidatus Cloacimonadaceae bacterium]
MRLKTFPGGIHPHDEKHYSASAPISNLPTPERVIIHLSQHIGAVSSPTVKVGDTVLKGQVVAVPAGFVSLVQHASISGKVTKIGKFLHPTGAMSMGIEISSDQQDQSVELHDDPDFMSLDPDELIARVSAAGICGMGGAGFPTHVKLSPPQDKPIDTVILNGVECEPFLTSDYRLMLERSEDILHGLRIIMRTLSAKKGIIGIEANKPDAIKLMQKLTAKEKDLSVVGFKLQYPQGAEKQLIYAATKRKVPAGGLPMAVGVDVQNVGTAAAIYEAVRYQKPLIERVISVTGPIVNTPMNLLAPIGALYSDLLKHCGGVSAPIGKAISGGPMMGFALPSLDAAMTKGSSGLVLFDEKSARSMQEHTCLRCAHCVDICPMNLMPSMIANAVKYNDLKMAVKGGLNDCIKCGSCAYVCPAHIRLVQWIDTGKIRYAEAQRNK